MLRGGAERLIDSGSRVHEAADEALLSAGQAAPVKQPHTAQGEQQVGHSSSSTPGARGGTGKLYRGPWVGLREGE